MITKYNKQKVLYLYFYIYSNLIQRDGLVE